MKIKYLFRLQPKKEETVRKRKAYNEISSRTYQNLNIIVKFDF